MRYTILIILLIFFKTAVGQDTVRINISYIDTAHHAILGGVSCSTGFAFNNISDSNFITFWTRVTNYDMGTGTCHANYRINPNLPDGHYEIYIDSFLYEVFALKDNLKFGESTQYHYKIIQHGRYRRKWDRKQKRDVYYNRKEHLFHVEIIKKELTYLNGEIDSEQDVCYETTERLTDEKWEHITNSDAEFMLGMKQELAKLDEFKTIQKLRLVD